MSDIRQHLFETPQPPQIQSILQQQISSLNPSVDKQSTNFSNCGNDAFGQVSLQSQLTVDTVSLIPLQLQNKSKVQIQSLASVQIPKSLQTKQQITNFDNAQMVGTKKSQDELIFYQMVKLLEEEYNQQEDTKKRQFKFFYCAGSPQSLTVLQPLEDMPFHLINDTKFFLLQPQADIQKDYFYQILEKVKNELAKISGFNEVAVLKTFDELKQYENQDLKKKSTIVVFCTNQLSQQQKKQTKSKFYVVKQPKEQIPILTEPSQITYVNGDDLTKVVKQYKLLKQLPNFLFINPQQIGSSNRLMRVMMAMLNQKISKEISVQILQQFVKLILIMDQKSEAYVNFQNFQKVGKKFVKDIANGRDAIKWYTSETSIYKLVNNLLRSTRHPAEIYYVQPFFKSLYNQIQTIFKQKIQKQGRTNFKCFRGAWLTQEQILKLKSSRGEIIISLGFLSTTLDEKTSNNFGNCLLQIEVPEEQTNYDLCPGYANIENYSNHPQQKEILFNPLNNFLVVDFFDNPKFNKITFSLRYELSSFLSYQTTLNILLLIIMIFKSLKI